MNQVEKKEHFPENRISEVELIYKYKVPYSARTKITCSKDTYSILLASWNPNKIELQEQFKILLLDRSNAVLGIAEISSGGITGTVVDIRIILSTALKANATSLILCHNHPSGNLSPSVADETITTKIKTAAAFLDIHVLDHIILSNEGYFSFADEGRI